MHVLPAVSYFPTKAEESLDHSLSPDNKVMGTPEIPKVPPLQLVYEANSSICNFCGLHNWIPPVYNKQQDQDPSNSGPK